jgi:hypothetical protein
MKYNIIVVGIVCLGAGFFAGRKTSPEKFYTTEKVRMIKGETVHDTVEVLIPYFTGYTDTVMYSQTVEKPVFVSDTSLLKEIWADYFLTGKYNLDFSSDSTGVFVVDLTVNRNRVVAASAVLQPYIKVIERVEKRTLIPFASFNYSTLDIVGVGGGVFYHDLGVEYQFQKQYVTGITGHCFSLKYKF